ncbi:MAG: hypothetical protein ACFB4I_09670 [Cyanophyceae cyanobacterium]
MDNTVQPQTLATIAHSSWWSKLVALVALVNFLLVLFNLSYIPLRDFYVHHVPALVRFYDPVKSIEPHPDTVHYLQTVEALKQQTVSSGLESTSTAALLTSLRQQSADLIQENPFLDANKFDTFAQLKRRLEYQLQNRSTEQALNTLWSQDYLTQASPQAAFAFFDSKIRPLLETNYFRQVDENGRFVDRFWQLDLGFVIFFGLEYLVRTFRLSTRRTDLSWWDAILQRWYDALLLLPTWRWLRAIPVTVRVHQSGLFNLERILAQVTHEPAAYLAERVSNFMIVNLINQTQEAVAAGDAARWLLQPKPHQKVNEIDEVDVIVDRILQLAIYKVVPQIQPDLEALLRYNLREALKQSDFYQALQSVPGIEGVPIEVTEGLADYLAQSVYEVLVSSYSDVQGRVLFDNLADNFKQALRKELRDQTVQAELQTLLADLLEEIKLNYLERSTEQDPEETLAEAEQLRQELE